MSIFVTTEDFGTGDILISQTSKTKKNLQFIIEIQEEAILQELFGSELYGLFIADLVDGVPQDPRFVAVFEKFYNDEDASYSYGCWCGGAFRSDGIKRMLMWFIYWQFVKDQPFENTSVGTVRNADENSEILTPSQFGLATSWNYGVQSYHAIARLMIDDPATYPEYKGIKREILSTLL